MPRQNPIPERETQICERLRLARHASIFSQAAFARLLGIEANTLASYELGRVPTRFKIAHHAADITHVSLHWLATGEEPRNLHLSLDQKILNRISEKELFSAAYDVWLRKIFEAEIRNLSALTGGKLDADSISKFQEGRPHNFVGVISPNDVLRQVESLVKQVVWSIPPHLYQEIYSDICVTITQFHRRHLEEIDNFPKDKLPKFPLTDVSLSGNNPNVKAQLPALLKRLNEATKERGTKTELAKFMGVKLPNVSQWLSGEKEPGGENTLRLLYWVEQQERQK